MQLVVFTLWRCSYCSFNPYLKTYARARLMPTGTNIYSSFACKPMVISLKCLLHLQEQIKAEQTHDERGEVAYLLFEAVP